MPNTGVFTIAPNPMTHTLLTLTAPTYYYNYTNFTRFIPVFHEDFENELFWAFMAERLQANSTVVVGCVLYSKNYSYLLGPELFLHGFYVKPAFRGKILRHRHTGLGCWMGGGKKASTHSPNTLLKSDVTRRDHVIRCRGSQECGSRFVNFACQFHSRRHSLRITLKSTKFVCMLSSNE